MKYLIITILILTSIILGTQTEAALFDWSAGQPAIIDDNTNTTYYGWSGGMPAVLYQYQTEAPLVETSTSTPTAIFNANTIFNGNIIIN